MYFLSDSSSKALAAALVVQVSSSVKRVACCLQEAAIAPKTARTIGIAVDHRRKNRSLESLQVAHPLMYK